MKVRIWGGPNDGGTLNVRDDAKMWKVPVPATWNFSLDPMHADGPSLDYVEYRIMPSPYGLVAVHPSVNVPNLP